MGIFSFLKSAGEKLIPGKDDAPPKAAELSEQELSDLTFQNRLTRFAIDLGVPVKGLKVRFKSGKATVEGQAESQAHRENVIIAIGNTAGVDAVDDRMTVVHSAPQATFYTVKPGDTLGKIAKEHYGNASKYPAIFEANRPMLSDPDKIYPGQVLRIPQEGAK
ncbi:MAG: peptidoglycan-binding protein LysM [Gemmatimonadota bacterium]